MEPSPKKRALALSQSDSDDSRYGKLAEIKQSVRLSSVSTKAKDPITPYQSILKRLQSNLKLKELSEEDYVACIESIIERDYFPDLIKLRYMHALEEARKEKNEQMVQILSEKIEQVINGNNDTKGLVELKTLQNETVRVDLGPGGLGLSEFCRIFTSEDNKSYDSIVHANVLAAIENQKWIENMERKNNLALSDIQAKTNLGIKSDSLASNREKARNELFFGSNPIPNVARPKIFSQNATISKKQQETLSTMETEQKLKRQDIARARDLEHLHDQVAIHGLGDFKDQIKEQGFVSTPLIESDSFNVPKPVPREELALQLLKRYQTPKTKSGKPLNDATPLIISKLVKKYQSQGDLQLRRSYARSSRSASVTSSKRRKPTSRTNMESTPKPS
ncbi:Nuclear protein DGCR14-ESS-2 [Babesia duncani]|uniref:Nuclear protein DGCR14-ESS-2 n=1 Tax=Babesia duncani TaxID=323732 RepID=A0AAD9PKU9_9APIC|nr:Nuclear protein DGCR14-ESS-2 [Babesia duncani]